MATISGDPYVFVSYASRDRDLVFPVVERLEQAGVGIWIDREGIPGGANYGQEIAEALKGCAVVLLMCSSRSFASRNVKQEIALAWRFERPYLPLLLEEVAVPDDVAYWLEGAQWVEVLDHAEERWLPRITAALAPLGIITHENTVARQTSRPRPLIVGQEREQRTLLDHLDRAMRQQGRVVLLGGEAGIGKTTLVENLAIDAEDRGVLVLWGHCYDLTTTPPYGPWLEIARRYTAGEHEPPFPAFLHDEEALAAIGTRERLFTQVSEFFTARSAIQPVMLVIDDLQWADDGSLGLLRFLAREVSAHRLLIVATYRSEEVVPGHPLSTLLPLLLREARADRIEIRRLDEESHRSLISARYRLTDADLTRLSTYLCDHAEGNALYATELLRTLEDEGTLAKQSDGWRLGDLSRAMVPPLLREVIDRRIDRLSDETKRLLPIAAVIGQEVSIELWQGVSGVTDDALLDAVDEAVAARVLTALDDGSRICFSHTLIRQSLYESLLSPRRRIWHRKVAELLEQGTRPDPDAVAHHYEQAGDARAITWLTRAAEQARQRYAWRTAGERLESALRMVESLSEANPRQQSEILVALGEVQSLDGSDRGASGAGDVPAARETFQHAARLAREAGSAELLARAALGYSGIGVAGMGGALEAALLAEAREALPDGDSSLRVRVLGRLVEARWWLAIRWAINLPESWQAWVEELQQLAEDAVAMARRIGEPSGLIAALSSQVIVATGPTASERYLAVSREQIALAERLGTQAPVLLAYHWWFLAAAQQGDMESSTDADRQLATLVTTYQITFFEWLLTAQRVALALHDGRLNDAEDGITEAERIWPNSAVVLQQLFTLRREQGRTVEITRQVRDTRARDPITTSWIIIELLIRIESGSLRGVRETLRSLVDQWIERPAAAEWLRSMSWLAEAVVAVDDTELAATLYRTLTPYAEVNLVMGVSDLAGGAVTHYLGLLARTMGTLPTAEAHFAAAYERNERWGNRIYLAHTSYEWADLLAERDAGPEHERAGTLLDTAENLASDIGLVVLGQRCRALRERLASLAD